MTPLPQQPSDTSGSSAKVFSHSVSITPYFWVLANIEQVFSVRCKSEGVAQGSGLSRAGRGDKQTWFWESGSPPTSLTSTFGVSGLLLLGRIKGLSTSVFKEGGRVGTCFLRSLHWEVLKKKPPISVWGSQLIMREWLKMAQAMWKTEWVFGNTGARNHSVCSPSTGPHSQVKPVRPQKLIGSPMIDHG